VTENKEVDDHFYDRADAHIHLSNDQCSEVGRGKVSASMLYAAARFNAWISACNTGSQSQLQDEREQTIDYFVSEYRAMLAETWTTTFATTRPT
jgi:hypothetical protein